MPGYGYAYVDGGRLNERAPQKMRHWCWHEKGNRRPPSGGMPSGGGMRGSKGGSRGSGMGAGKSKPESFKVWINVQLNLADNSNK